MVNKCSLKLRCINTALPMNILLGFHGTVRTSCSCACNEDISGSACIDPLICNLCTKYLFHLCVI